MKSLFRTGAYLGSKGPGYIILMCDIKLANAKLKHSNSIFIELGCFFYYQVLP